MSDKKVKSKRKRGIKLFVIAAAVFGVGFASIQACACAPDTSILGDALSGPCEKRLLSYKFCHFIGGGPYFDQGPAYRESVEKLEKPPHKQGK